jgi:putative two-component system response regulator
VCKLQSLQRIRPMIRWHHERLDGSGSPDGFRGDSTPILAQLVSVVDVFEASTTDRADQKMRKPQGALDVLRQQVQRGWRRREIVEAFVALIGRVLNVQLFSF